MINTNDRTNTPLKPTACVLCSMNCGLNVSVEDNKISKVEADDTLRAIFPDDLEPGKEWQYLFLMQYWGGPQTYSAQRGHPRLRMRHYPYAITPELANLWLNHMLDALDEVGIQEPARAIMREYFERGASFLVNRYSPQG